MRQTVAIPLLTLAIGLATGGSANGASAFSKALDHERAGRFAAALAVLDVRDDLPPYRRAHRAALRRAVRSFRAADAFATSGQRDYVRRVLARLRADPVRDVYVVRARNDRLLPLGFPGDRVARAHIVEARRLAAHDKHEQAAAALGAVAKMPSASVSPRLRETAERERIRESGVAAADDETLPERAWASVEDVVAIIAGWTAALAALVVLVVGARWLLHRFPRPGTLVRLTDLGAAAEDRQMRNSALTRDLIDEVSAVAAGAERDAPGGLTTRRDLDGVTVPAMSVSDTADFGAGLTHEEAPVQVGPFAFSPRQVWQVIRPTFARQWRYEMTGTLRVEGDTCALTVERTGRGRRAKPTHWHARDGSRADVIRNVATRVAVDLGGASVSSSWQSYRDYLEAMNQLDRESEDEDREATLTTAARRLERSLGRDPLNLLARFQLASVQRTLGDNRKAVANFEQVERMTLDGERRSATVRSLVERHPELFYVAMYNRAVALAKTGDWKDAKQARRMLTALVEQLIGESLPAIDDAEPAPAEPIAWPAGQPPAGELRKLDVLSRAAWASTLVFGLEPVQTTTRIGGEERLRKRRQVVLEHLDGVRSWLNAQRAEAASDPSLDTTIEQAHATVENARGQVLLALGDRDGARRAFEQAIVLLPDFSDAHVNLAAALMTRRRGEDVAEAERALTRALDISPRDVKARLLLGHLYAGARRWDSAKVEFRRLPDDHSATFALGEILRREGNLKEAIEQYSLSVAQYPSRGHRADVFVKAVLKLARSRQATLERIDEALVHARRLEQRGLSRKLQAGGATYGEQLRAVRAEIVEDGEPPEDPA